MRTDTTNFTAANIARSKRPRYVVELAFDSANSILWYFTSHTDAATPPGASVIANVIEGISGTSQTLSPDKANASIGNIQFRLVDKASTVTNQLGTQLALGRSTRRQRVRVYVGYEGLAWADYSLVQTQLLTDIQFDGGSYLFRCMDVQRQMRKEIFDLALTNLATSIDELATTISVVSTAAFTMVQHGTSYSDSPSATVGYIKLESEVIKYTGKTSTTFTGCTRGALNTRPVKHDADQSVTADQRLQVTEYVYLELPALKLVYALLTGTLYNQGGATLPTKWNLGIPTSYVQLSDFIGMLDLWDPADDTKGFVVRMEDLKKIDGKKFIEQELALLTGTFMPVYASGALGLRRMANVLAGAAYTRMLDQTNVKKASELTHDFDSLHNNLQIRWNWEPEFSDFTRLNILLDASSITVHGQSDPLNLEFRGLHGSIHSSTILSRRFDSLRDRYSGPPLRIGVDVLPSCNTLEIGDVVRLRLPNVRDFVVNGPIDRSFEVQSIKMDWVTGDLHLDLFGSSQAAGAIPATTDASVLSNAWYTSAGTDLATVLTITGSNPGHISANGTINGNASMTAAGAIFYYNGDLQLDAGVNVNITNNVQLRVKGFFQNNGTINGKGGGLAGAAAPAVTNQDSYNPGTQGFIGSTEAGGGFLMNFIGGSVAGLHKLDSTRGGVIAGNAVAPPFNLTWNGATLFGIPADLRGSSGSSGRPLYMNPASTIIDANVAGGAGGASGAGLIVVCRGFAQGVSAKIDLSGADGSPGTSIVSNIGQHPRLFSGSGAGGAPGALVVLLDGAALSATGLTEAGFVALNGKTPLAPGAVTDNPHYVTVEGPGVLSSMYVGTGDGTTFALPSMSGARGGSRVQYVPANPAAVADPGAVPLINPDSFSLIARAVAKVGGGFQTQLEATWIPTTDPLVAGYDVQYKKSVDTAWISGTSIVGRANSSAVIAQNLQPGINYDARLRAAGSLRQTADWLQITNFFVSPSRVSGLELDPTNRIDYSTFGGSDATVIWRADSHQTSYDIGSEPNGAGSGAVDPYQKDYLVRVLNSNGTLRREEVLTAIKEPKYTYTLEKNTQDGGGTATRSFSVLIFRRDNANQVSPIASTLDVANPQCGQPATFALRAEFNALYIDWTPPTGEIDCAGIIVNVSTTSPLTPSGTVAGSGNCRYAGPDRLISIDNVAPATTYYVKVACFDTFGKDNLNYSAEFSVTTDQVQTPDLAALSVITSKLADAAVATAKLADGAVVTAKLADLNVTLGKLASLSVDTTKLVDSAVTTVKVATDAITNAKLADASVGTSELIALSVTTAKVAAAAITANEIASLTIVAGNIAAGAITTAKITAGAVTSNEIASLTIVAGNIAANTITAAKIVAGTITTNEIASLTIVAGNIAANTITAAKIVAGTITTTEIASLTIVAGNIAASTITGAKIAANTITASNIVAGTITATEIAASTITGSKIAAGTITASNIAASTITANEIAASTITAGKLNISTLSAIAADMGSITAGTITLASSGYIKGGSASDYFTGAGFWLGISGGVAKMHIGDPSGNYMKWDGSALSIKGDANLTNAAQTFTPTWTGFSSDPSGDISYLDLGAIVILYRTSALTGTSNATSMTVTNLPSGIRPGGNRQASCVVVDDNTSLLGNVVVKNDGTLDFQRVEQLGTVKVGPSVNTFTNTGVKGLPAGWLAIYSK